MEAVNNNLNTSMEGYKSLHTETNRIEAKIAKVARRLTKSIYMVALLQYIAIVGSVVSIVTFMLHK